MPITIVLVHPEISQNVGFVARSMKCYNLTELYIIGRKYPPQSYAYKTGFTATAILDKARYFKTLEAAIKSFEVVLGFTRRPRDGVLQRTQDLLEVVPGFDFSKNTALVFGRESKGLFREECALMSRLVQIPLPNREMSLNLSHAVSTVLHEIYCHSIFSSNPFLAARHPDPSVHTELLREASTISEKQESFEYFVRLLVENKMFKDSKSAAHIQYLKNLWRRADPDTKEIEFIIGIIKKTIEVGDFQKT